LPGVVTVIVPAHNEARVIGRLLGQLASAARPGEFDVIVVANGCTDDTAQVAAASGPMIRVLSIPVPSKREALLAGPGQFAVLGQARRKRPKCIRMHATSRSPFNK
jgi:glycosyltransferase involved in cell wall biosynthesis